MQLLKKFKGNLRVLKKTALDFLNQNTIQQSAAIAYYTIFSLPGIAIISVWVAGSFYDRQEVREGLLNQTRLLMGESGASQIEVLMENAQVGGDTWILQTIGVITLIISTTTVFVSLQASLNLIWRIKSKPRRAILEFLMKRVLSLAMVASIGFLVLVSLLIDTVLAFFRFTLETNIGGFTYYIILLVNWAISSGIILAIFCIIYKVLPDAKILWKDVWRGGIVATVLFLIGKYLIGYYLSMSDLDQTYGTAGSLVAMLAWVYYSVVILMFGAHFTYAYCQQHGRKIMPNKDAVALEIREIERSRKAVTDVSD